jgi:ADP-ribosylglycohydrolase
MGSYVDKKSWEEISRDYGPNGLMGYDLVNGYAEITSYTQLAAYTSNGLLLGMSRYQPEYYGKFIGAALKEWSKCQFMSAPPEKSLCWISKMDCMRRRLCMDRDVLEMLYRDSAQSQEDTVGINPSPAALTCGAAVGLFFDAGRMEPRQVGVLGAEAMALTGADPEGVLSGAILAYSIAGIVQEPQMPLKEHFTHAVEAVAAQFGRRHPQIVRVAELVQKALELSGDKELPPLVAMTVLECTTAAECLAAAMYTALTCGDNFDEGMIAAVNHSGRSSAVGAITGAILGAKLGVEEIPEFYLESLDAVEVLKELATDMALGKQITRIFDDSWDQKYARGIKKG